MSKIALTPNASGSGTFTIASPNSNTDRTLTLPDEVGTVLTSASDISSQATQNVPAFHVRLSANHTGWDQNDETQVMPFDTVDLDSHSWFNTSTYTYTPQQAGWYYINFQWGSGSGYLQVMMAIINKNGSQVAMGQYYDAVSGELDDYNVQVSKIIYFNGSTDNIKFNFRQSGGLSSVSSDIKHTFAEGFLVRADS